MAVTLFHRGPSLAALHDEYAARGRIDHEAPVRSSSGTVVAAPAERVWAIMADVASWPSWASNLQVLELGEVRPGETFRWRLGPVTIRSRFARVDPGRELTWTGTFFWYRAVDRHVLEPPGDGTTRVTIEESLAGPLLPLLYGEARLRANHERWLAELKAVAEA
ncbi:hypothetical protein TBS_28420 [Thermobispora bispora]|uniref:SRPBCC family protein n=1 Tax=Thermobispora bispora TaxID=2006 RepID=UPI0023560584|nr:molecular chaperone Hsp90 [Actinomycetales bacterium]MBX6166496.1 SRPBCC family protein [Thermobispora bispora]